MQYSVLPTTEVHSLLLAPLVFSMHLLQCLVLSAHSSGCVACVLLSLLAAQLLFGVQALHAQSPFPAM